jgi:hypothetical protein
MQETRNGVPYETKFHVIPREKLVLTVGISAFSSTGGIATAVCALPRNDRIIFPILCPRGHTCRGRQVVRTCLRQNLVTRSARNMPLRRKFDMMMKVKFEKPLNKKKQQDRAEIW